MNKNQKMNSKRIIILIHRKLESDKSKKDIVLSMKTNSRKVNDGSRNVAVYHIAVSGSVVPIQNNNNN